MATKDGDFFRGALGNVVFRVVNNKQIVQRRVAPGAIKHTEATQKSNQTFGMASTFGTNLRQTLAVPLQTVNYNSLSCRLSGQLFSVLSATRSKQSGQYHFEQNSFQRIEGFNFNPPFTVQQRLDQQPEITLHDQSLSVNFPALSMKRELQFPYNSERCKISVSVSLFRLAEGKMVNRCTIQEKSLLKALAPFQSFQFTFHIPDGCFYVVVVWLEYSMVNPAKIKTIREAGASSAAILKARFSPGSFTPDNKIIWLDINPL